MTAETKVNHPAIAQEGPAAAARARAKRVHAQLPKPKAPPRVWPRRVAISLGAIALVAAVLRTHDAEFRLAKAQADNGQLAAMVRAHQDAVDESRFVAVVAKVNVPSNKAEHAMAAAVASLGAAK